MIKQLISIKQKQLEAFHNQAWDEVSQLENQVHALMADMTIDPKALDEHHHKLINQFIDLHKQILELASATQEEHIKQMLNFQKSKSAAKAYGNK